MKFLVGGEVTGCFGNLSHNLLVPTSPGSICVQHIITILHLGGGLGFCITTQRYVSDCYVYPLRRK